MGHWWHDAIVSVPITASQLMLVVGSFCWATRIDRSSRLSRRIAGTILCSWASIALAAFLSSSFGVLSPIWFYSLLAILGLVLWGLGQGKANEPAYGHSGHSTQSRNRSTRTVVFVAIAACVIARIALHGVVRLPCDWDSLAYHIPLVDHWIQDDHLWGQNCAFWYVPGNAEVVGYWLVAGYSGDFWIGLSNLPSIALLIASTLEMLVLLRVRWPLRSIAIVSLLSTQIVNRQLVSQENDLAAIALFISAVMFGWCWIKRNSFFGGIHTCLAIGLLAGTKYYALGYAGICVTGIGAFAWVIRGNRQFVISITCMATAIICLSGFWYARNWILTGSPLYPKGFPSLGMPDLWAQIRPGNELSTLVRGSTVPRWRLLTWAWLVQAGPSSLIAVILGPLVCSITIYMANARMRLALCYVLAAMIGALCVYSITPNVIESVAGTENMLRSQYHSVRFGGPALAICCIGFAVSVSQIRRSRLRFAITRLFLLLVICDALFIAGFHLGFTESLRAINVRAFWPHGYTADPVAMALTILNVILCIAIGRQVFTRSLQARLASLCVLTVGISTATGWLSHRWHANYDSHFELILLGDALPKVRQHFSIEHRVCACFYRYYPLLRSDRRGQVVRPLHIPDDAALIRCLRSSKSNGLIMPLLLPAVQSARESARAVQCASQIRQLSLGIHHHQNRLKRFPGNGGDLDDSTIENSSGVHVPIRTHDLQINVTFRWGIGVPSARPSEQPGSWGYAILPDIDQHAVYEAIDVQHAGPLFLCPSRSRGKTAQPRNDANGIYEAAQLVWAKTDYAGNASVIRNRPVTLAPRDISDGLSNTLALGEKAFDPNIQTPTSWYWDEPIFSGGSRGTIRSGLLIQPDQSGIEYKNHWGSAHKDFAMFSMLDGSIRRVARQVDWLVFRAALSPAGGESSSL